MRDRDLVRLYWPKPLRAPLDLLLALDDRLAEAALGASQPAVGAIKLAWWRDQLAALGSRPPPPEPLLGALADGMPQHLTGPDLASLADAWLDVVDEAEDPAPRGRAMFELLGRLLGTVGSGGEPWSRADLARRTGEPRWLVAKSEPGSSRNALPIALFDALGRRDVARGWPPEPEATPARAWVLLRHRLTGR